MTQLFGAAYVLSVASVLGIVLSVTLLTSRSSVRTSVRRLFLLSKDEGSRLSSGDPVFLMHLSIALGIGLTVVDSLLGPFFPLLGPVEGMIQVASLPLLAGLVAAFVWRVQRLAESKRVEKEVLRSPPSFTSRSTRMQLVLMAAISLTSLELALTLAPSYAAISDLVGAARNVLVAVYYARPSLNLVAGFDRPLWKFDPPFLLADVVSGKTDPSTIRAGVGKMSEFSQAETLSFDSCVEIGACEAACPATAAGRPLSPRALVRELSILGKTGGDADPHSSVADEELWSCTSCGACVSSCPVSVKHLDAVYDLRRDLVARGSLDKEKATVLENLARTRNPYGLPQRTRGDWAKRMGVQTASSGAEAEYVYWVGCVSSFDQRAQRVATSVAKILTHAGVSFAILGEEESCTGDPARRLGEEGRFQELALQNIGRLSERGATKIVASCPHCYNSLKNEYPALGGRFQVVYHTELISDLIREGRVKLEPGKSNGGPVTFHDACYASRYNGVLDEPRLALEAAGEKLREMKRRKEKTFCCGAGGSNYWFKVPQQRSIAGIRTEEAASTGAKSIATECPFCLSMLEDSAKASGGGLGVRDVAEIVADALTPEPSLLRPS